MTLVRTSPSGELVDLGNIPNIDTEISANTSPIGLDTGTADVVQVLTSLSARRSKRVVEFVVPQVVLSTATAFSVFYIDRLFADVPGATEQRLAAAVCGPGQQSVTVRCVDEVVSTGTVALYFLKGATNYGTGEVVFADPLGSGNITHVTGTAVAL